jgi:superfamily II DNA or RNA helicase
MSFELRQYQKDTLNKLIKSHRAGNKRIILQAATGAGKTIMAAALVKYFTGLGKTVLFLAHRRELITQASEKLDMSDIPHGIIMANHRSNDSYDVQIASIDTLRARAITKKKMDLPSADVIFIDEAHRSLSNTYLKLIGLYSESLLVGLTATPVRGNGEGLGVVYSDMVTAPSIKELTKQGNLVDVKYYSPSVPDLKGVGVIGGDFNSKSLNERMDQPKLVGDIVETWLHLAKGKQTIVFAAGVKHSQNLMELFQSKGVKAAHLDGTTENEERIQILKDFNSGKITVVCNCMVLTEGFDAPCAEVCVLARPTKSLGLYIQMVGRVLRPHHTKEKAMVIDHSGAVYINGFVDDEHKWDLGTGILRKRAERKERTKEESVIICEGCFRTYSGGNICPTCGQKHQPKSDYMNFIDSQLCLIDKKTKKAEEKEKYAEGFRDTFYEELLGMAEIKGYKKGWANYKFKQRFGEWPPKGDFNPQMPSLQTRSYVKHLQIKEVKAKQKVGNLPDKFGKIDKEEPAYGKFK